MFLERPTFNTASPLKKLEMPFNRPYEVLPGVIHNTPRVVIREFMASDPRSQPHPTLTELLDPAFYNKLLKPTQIYNKFSQSPNKRKERRLISPIEATPFFSNEDSSHIKEIVQYVYAAQDIVTDGDGLKLNWSTNPRSVHDGKIELVNPSKSEFEGVAYVAHARAPIKLSDFFPTPKDMKSFRGELPLSKEEAALEKYQKAQEMFEKLFQPKLEEIGKQVRDVRKKPIKGILLSPIVPHCRFTDSVPDPEGELVIAASYLA